MARKTTTDYVAEIRKYGPAQLVTLLHDIKAGKPLRGWASGRAFEHLVLRGFEVEGADVVWPYTVTHDRRVIEQIDGAVYSEGLACLVEAKDYGEELNIEPVAKLRTQLARRPPDVIGLLFARSDYTEPMKMLIRLINPPQVLLWQYEELDEALQKQAMCQALRLKYRHAVEQGAPDYNVKGKLR